MLSAQNMFSSLQMRNTIGLSDLDLSLSIFQTTFFSQFFRERLVLSDVNTFLILNVGVSYAIGHPFFSLSILAFKIYTR